MWTPEVRMKETETLTVKAHLHRQAKGPAFLAAVGPFPPQAQFSSACAQETYPPWLCGRGDPLSPGA